MSITALHIGANSIKALHISGRTFKKREAALPPGSIRNGLILQPEVIGKEIRALLKAGKFPSDSVVCAVNGLPFSYRFLNVPEVAPSAMNEAVLRTARKEMSISPDEMYLSWRTYPAAGDEWQVLVTGITRHPVDNLIKALDAAGIRPWLLDLPHLALARLSPHKDAVIIDLEKDCSNIVMMVDGIPRGMHMVPALAPGASLRDQLVQVADKLSKMIEFYNGSHPAKPVVEPVRILVTGELMEDPDAKGLLEEQIGYSVEFLDLPRLSPDGKDGFPYAVSAGLLHILTGETDKNAAPFRNLNLETIIKERRPKTDVRKVVKKSLVPCCIAVGLALLGVLYVSHNNILNDVAALQAGLNRVNAELSARQAAIQQAQELQAKIDGITSVIEQIQYGRRQIFSSREYVDDISAVVSSMPEGIIFNSLSIDAAQIMLDGVSREAGTVVVFADNLETIGGFPEAVIQWIDRPRETPDKQMEVFFRITINKQYTAEG